MMMVMMVVVVLPKRKLIFQPQCFRCYVNFREGMMMMMMMMMMMIQ